MAIDELRIREYRSVRSLDLRLDRVTVVVGPNGCGKTNLYRAMLLLHRAASGQLARSLLEEGGMPSALWAGPRGKDAVRMHLGFTSGPLRYDLKLGLPVPGTSFQLDPRVKEEVILYAEEGLPAFPLLERGKTALSVRDDTGRRINYPLSMLDSESVFSQVREPHRFPQVSALREEILAWRFYHHFSTEPGSPLRQRQPGILTPVLSHDGSDLAAALATIYDIGDGPSLDQYIRRGFPGMELQVGTDSEHRFGLTLRSPDLNRPLSAQELSDGTLRYLCLAAALLSPRPPALLALNEPETSLHPDLMEPLAELIARASRDSQVWVTTHSETLAGHLRRLTGTVPLHLEKINGETRVRSPLTS